MNEQVEHLQALALEQRELIKKLLDENLRLNTLTRSLNDRIENLEQQQLVIDREITEMPIGLDLVPENDLNRP